MFITYALLDPRKPGVFQHPFGTFDHQPVYIGKGRPDRPSWVKRVLSGCTDEYSGRLVNNWLSCIRDLGFRSVPVVIIKETDEVTAFAVERILTKHFGIVPEGGILYNGRHGGDGGWSLSAETKELLRELNSGKNNPNFGKKASDETLRRRAETWSKKDRSRSPESMSNAWEAMRREYKITTNTGEVHLVKNLTAWCSEHKYPLSALRAALKSNDGIVKSKSRCSRIEGWQIKYLD